MAELHGPEPVELEVSVEVAASPDPLEGERAGGMGGPQKPKNHPQLSHYQLAMGNAGSFLAGPFVESTGDGSAAMMLMARLSCRH